MNIINKAFLNLALLPLPFYSRMGVHSGQLRAILTAKLLMDDRRVSPLAQVRQTKNSKPASRATLGTMLLSGVMGLLFLSVFAFGENISTQLTFYFSMFFFMLSAILISDFTSVLIDIRDNFIILPKPVNDRTFVMARLLHIFIHICKLVLPLSLPAMVFLGHNTGIGGAFVFSFLVLLVTLFSIFFINAVYLLVLKVTTPEKFQNFIAYFQIAFAIGIYASYQLLPRLFLKYNLENLAFATYKGIIFYPFYWFAACWKLLVTGKGSLPEIAAAALAIAVPLFSLYLVVKYLAPSFNNRLALINGGSEGSRAASPAKGSSRNINSYSKWLSFLFTKAGPERAGFLFSWKMMGRSRDFKLKVYPSVGYLLVYAVLMLFSPTFRTDDLQGGGPQLEIMALAAIYFSSFVLISALSQLEFTDKYRAAWIFYTTPVSQPGAIILGGMKAAICRFYVPITIILTLPILALLGWTAVPNLVLGLANQLLIATVMVYARKRLFPFSLSQSNNQKAGSFIRNIMILIVSGFIAMGHFFIYNFLPVVIIFVILSCIATWAMMQSIRLTPWPAIKSSYTED